MPYVLREWSAPETLIHSLADGTGIESSVAETKSSFADFLVKGGVAPAQAAQAADALVHRIIDALAHGGSPETAVATAKEDIGGVIAHLIEVAKAEGPPGLDQALAQGDAQALARAAHELGIDGLPPEAQKAALTAWQSALANGADSAHAREAALDKAQSMVKALADGAVDLSHGDSLAAHLAGGGPDAAAAIQAMTAGLPSAQAAAMMNSLAGALAGGFQPSEALQGALAAARSAQATGDSQGVPVSQGDMLVAALAGGGDIHAALAAAGLSGAAADAFLQALAGSAGSDAALSLAHEAQAAANQALAQASAGVKGSALAAALASGGAEAAAALAGMGGDGAAQDAFMSALGQALAGGASLDSALGSADSAGSQTAATASATGSSLLAALASGQNAAGALAAAGVSGGEGGQAFAAALSSALASGTSVEAAVQQASSAASAAESQVASSSSPVGSTSPAGFDSPSVPGTGGADQSPTVSQSPPSAPGPESSSPASSSPPPLSIAEMLNPGGNNPPPPPPAAPPVADLPVVTPTPPPAALSDTATPPATPPHVTDVAQASGPVVLTGHLIDGPIKGGRVVVDANNNGVYDSGEYYVITDANGTFSIAADKLAAGKLTYDAVTPTGVDTATLAPFKVALTAPLGVTNLTAFTNLIAAVMAKGYSEADATAKVATAVGASSSANLLTYDPANTANQGSALAKTAANLLVVLSGISSTITGSGVTSSTTTAMGAVIDALATQVTSTSGTVNLADTTVIATVMASAQTTAATATLADSGSSADAIAVATAMKANATNATTLVADNTNSQMVQIISGLVSTIAGAATTGDVNAATQTALGDASTTLATIAGNQAATVTDNSAAATSNLANSLSYAVDKFTGSGLTATVAAAKTDIANNQDSTTTLSPPTAVADAAATTQNAAITISVLANDSDPQGNSLSLVNIVHLDTASTTTKGTVVINANGTVTYNPGHVFDYLAAGQTTTDSFGYVVGNGTGQNATSTVTVTITGTNDAPVLATAGSTSYTEGGGGSAVAPSLTVSDVDTATHASATVAISSGFFTGDILAATTTGTAITASYDSGTGVLSLAGTDTLAHYQSVLRSVTFSSTSVNPTDYGADTSRTISFQTSDGQGSNATSAALNSTVAVVGVNNAPVLTTAGSTTYTQGGAADAVAPAVTASDVDSLNLTSATATISGGFLAGDTLAATTTGTSITASYNSATGVLTLSGSDTVAHYQAVLRSVAFSSTSGDPTDTGADTSRTITFQTSDGQSANATSATLTSTVTVVGSTLAGSTDDGSGHYFQYYATSGAITWEAAEAIATGSTYLGATGHLAVITSSAENTLVANLLNGADSWLGGIRDGSQIFRWVVSDTAISLSNPADGYSNWNAGEPNNAGGHENALEMYNSGALKGKWNDISDSSSITAYVVEYDVPVIASAVFSNDSGTAGDFITNAASQTISGTLSTALLSGETVSVSVDGGATWQAATATVGQTTWSLSGQSLNSGTHALEVEITAGGSHGTVYSQNYTLDTTAPTLSSAVVNAGTLVLTYNETLAGSATPAAADYTVLVGGTPDTVTAVAVDSANKTVTLTLTSAVASTDTVTVDYNGGSDAHPVQDVAGNAVATLSANAVTNATPGGTHTGAGVSQTVENLTANTTYVFNAVGASGTPDTIMFITFDSGFNPNAAPYSVNTTGQAVTLGGANAHVLSGSGSSEVVFVGNLDGSGNPITDVSLTHTTSTSTTEYYTDSFFFNDDSNGTYSSQIVFTPAQNTTCYVYAGGYNGSTVTYTLTVTPDPPLPAVAENCANPLGESIAALFAGADPAQVVITADYASVSQGSWQYSTSGGADWVSLVGGGTPDIVLNSDSLLRFVPGENWNGTPGGLLAGLMASAGGAITSYEEISTSVTAVNDAPVASGEATLPAVAENAADPAAATVATLLSANFSDAADAVAGGSSAASLAGVAIVGDMASHDQGAWQYSADHGAHWTAIDTGVSDASALVLSASDELRFVPGQGFEGTPGVLTARLIESGGEAPVTGSVLDLSAPGATGGSSHVSAGTVAIATGVSPGPTLADDHALGFDGSSHVDVAAAAPLSPTAALTLEAWVQLSAAGGSIIDDLSGNAGYKLAVDAAGHLQFTIGDGGATTTLTGGGASLADGGWHQVAASYDGASSSLHLFVDNADVADLTGVSAGALGAGGALSFGDGLNGSLNDVRLWSDAHGLAQIGQETSHALSGSESGLAGYWRFDDPSGTAFANSVAGATYGTGTASGTPSIIDLLNQSSGSAIQVAAGASAYKGMILGSDAGGGQLSYAVDGNGAPAHGTVAFTDNAFVYTPTSGHITQDDSFTVDVTDAAAHTVAHSMTLHPV